jgi:hypothetical protein
MKSDSLFETIEVGTIKRAIVRCGNTWKITEQIMLGASASAAGTATEDVEVKIARVEPCQ